MQGQCEEDKGDRLCKASVATGGTEVRVAKLKNLKYSGMDEELTGRSAAELDKSCIFVLRMTVKLLQDALCRFTSNFRLAEIEMVKRKKNDNRDGEQGENSI